MEKSTGKVGGICQSENVGTMTVEPVFYDQPLIAIISVLNDMVLIHGLISM